MEFWAEFATRASQDDDTITPDKIEIIRQQLPEALLSINAQLAIGYCADGRHSHAERQARTIWESKFSEKHRQDAVRGATKHIIEQLHALSTTAETRVKGKPEDGLKVVTDLLDKARPLLKCLQVLNLNDTLNLGHAAGDAVAGAGMAALIAYANKTQDWQPLVAPNREIISIAHSEALKATLKKNLDTLEENVRGQLLEKNISQHLEPLMKQFEAIDARTTLADKLRIVELEIMPHIRSMEREAGMDQAVYDACADCAARYIRGLSISFYNDLSDIATSTRVLEIAISIARGRDLSQQLAKDKGQLSSIKAESAEHDAHVEIRSDVVEITSDIVRYNERTLPAREISGIAFGIYKHTTNGIQDTCSYLINLRTERNQTLSIECDRFFRSEAKIQADFNRILESLFHHVIPGLVTRLADRVVSGTPLQMGECQIAADGVRFSTGMLMWKKQHFVPWAEVRFATYQGQLSVFSEKDKRIVSSYSLRDIWNAVIFEYIAKAIVQKRSGR